MATEFKKLILSIEITEDERKYFIHMCSDWGLFCSVLSSLSKYKLMKLLKYLATERVKSKYMLTRCIGRFNKLNALVIGGVI